VNGNRTTAELVDEQYASTKEEAKCSYVEWIRAIEMRRVHRPLGYMMPVELGASFQGQQAAQIGV
jgi:hypothetical protein